MISWLVPAGRSIVSIVLLVALGLFIARDAYAVDPVSARLSVLDAILAEHWSKEAIVPAAKAGDLIRFRRVKLDLTGRIPTVSELEGFEKDNAADRYDRAVVAILNSPEFSQYFATVLDEMIQGPYAGNASFITYLRSCLQKSKGWNTIFREIMLGPWDSEDRKPAIAFLERRAKDLDQLTADVTRSFFGVDITCARCHDHPLVKAWKREHYYGMAAFLVRTTGGKGSITEKAEGEAKFAGKDGKEKVARMMFLSGKTVEDAPRIPLSWFPFKPGRREQLVNQALADQDFLSRAFVNRVWEYFLGRGLVDPVDQLHSGNLASIPALLDSLAEEFVRDNYDIQRLVKRIVLTQAYQLDSQIAKDQAPPEAEHFAIAQLRPLSPRQFATSLLMAAGEGKFDATQENLKALEKQVGDLLPRLDPRTREFQSSTREALFLSNSDVIQKLIAPTEKNLVGRLRAMTDPATALQLAYRTILSRNPSAGEKTQLLRLLPVEAKARDPFWEDIVWALVTSAEFRFNH